MSNHPYDPTLDPCGCCEDLPERDRANRPGLPAIQYRLGSYGTFLEELLTQLARPVIPDGPTLSALKTRELDDGAIALLDAWAVVADVLTFYQERIANENYLETATERRSVLELARAIGYELNPGVAASTYLAFTVEGATNPYQTAVVAAGTQVQSIPEQDQLPQTFETSEEIIARATWNKLQPPQTRSHVPTAGDQKLYLAGISTRLEPGDWLLFVGKERQNSAASDRWEVRRLLTVESNPQANHTLVTWDEPLPSNPLPANPKVHAFRARANIYGANAQDWRSLPDVAKATYLGLASPDDLTQQDKQEWPYFSILAPKAVQEIDEVTSTYEIAATPQSAAAAIKSAIRTRAKQVQLQVTTATGDITHQAANLVDATVVAADDAVNMATAVVQQVTNDAVMVLASGAEELDSIRTLAQDHLNQVVTVARQMIDAINGLANGLLNVGNEAIDFDVAGAIDSTFELLNVGDDAVTASADLQLSLEDLPAAYGELTALLANSPVAAINNLARNLLEQIDDTLLEAAPSFSDLSDRAAALVNSTQSLTDRIGEATGATVAQNILELALDAALRAPPPLPPPTVDAITAIAQQFAEASVVLASDGAEVAATTAALSSPYGVPLAATILGFDAVLGAGAETGAEAIRAAVEATIPGAIAPTLVAVSPETERRPRPIFHSNKVDLDTLYPKVTPGSWVMLSSLNNRELYRVSSITEAARSDFGLTAKTTRLTLSGPALVGSVFEKAVRGTSVYAESEVLELAETPLTEPIAGNQVAIAGLVEALLPGVALAISGKVMRAQIAEFETGLVLAALDESNPDEAAKAIPAGALLWVEAPPKPQGDRQLWTLRDITGFTGTVLATPAQIFYAPALEDDETVSEIAFLKTLPTFNPTTHLVLESALQRVYDRATFTINANVAPATHGETVQTVLGNGDGAQAYQAFTLKKPPLTFTSADTASGREATLTVRVNNVLWSETRGFFGLQPDSENYLVRIEDDSTTRVIFGDGQQGARLPTGLENVTATYRSGIGLVGEVAAGSLSLIKTRPLGIRSVVNPVAASGAEDPERLDKARENAPLTVLTLDRIVSRQDYEDFARAFAGIGKAQAIAIWDGFRKQVHITIAAANGQPIANNSKTYQNLKQAIADLRDPGPPFLLDSFTPRTFNLKGTLQLDDRYLPERVLTAVSTALLEEFSFAQREFGQGVSAAEVITLIQGIEGIIAVDLDRLYRADRPAQFNTFVAAEIAQWNSTSKAITQTELLLLNAAGIELEVKV